MAINTGLLKEIGLTKAETEVYLVLLKSGQMIASQVAKSVQMQRPNAYDTLKRLIDKGLVNYVIKNNLKCFQAACPDKLKDYVEGLKKDIEEKEAQIDAIIPDLKKMSPMARQIMSVETYEGKEGMRTVLFDSLRETRKAKNEILGIGINNLKIKNIDPVYYERYVNERKKIHAKSRYIIIEGTEIFTHPDAMVKVLPPEFQSPSATYIYGDKVSVWLWCEIPVVIVISSKDVADSYRSYFEALWNIAK